MEERPDPGRGKSRSSLTNVTPLDFIQFLPLSTRQAPTSFGELQEPERAHSSAAIREAASLLGNLDPINPM